MNRGNTQVYIDSLAHCIRRLYQVQEEKTDDVWLTLSDTATCLPSGLYAILMQPDFVVYLLCCLLVRTSQNLTVLSPPAVHKLYLLAGFHLTQDASPLWPFNSLSHTVPWLPSTVQMCTAQSLPPEANLSPELLNSMA